MSRRHVQPALMRVLSEHAEIRKTGNGNVTIEEEKYVNYDSEENYEETENTISESDRKSMNIINNIAREKQFRNKIRNDNNNNNNNCKQEEEP